MGIGFLGLSTEVLHSAFVDLSPASIDLSLGAWDLGMGTESLGLAFIVSSRGAKEPGILGLGCCGPKIGAHVRVKIH